MKKKKAFSGYSDVCQGCMGQKGYRNNLQSIVGESLGRGPDIALVIVPS